FTNDTIGAYKSPLLADLIELAHKNIISKTEKIRTVSSYESHKRFFIAYLKERKLYKIHIERFSRIEANDFQNFLISEKYAAKTVNTKTEYCSGLFSALCRMGVVKENPFFYVQKLKNTESTKHQIYTRQELKEIKNYLLEHCPELWQFALFIYYCFMRPDS